MGSVSQTKLRGVPVMTTCFSCLSVSTRHLGDVSSAAKIGKILDILPANHCGDGHFLKKCCASLPLSKRHRAEGAVKHCFQPERSCDDALLFYSTSPRFISLHFLLCLLCRSGSTARARDCNGQKAASVLWEKKKQKNEDHFPLCSH